MTIMNHYSGLEELAEVNKNEGMSRQKWVCVSDGKQLKALPRVSH